MKLSKYLSLLVSVVVLSAWSFRFNQPSVFRGGNAVNMSEEFAVYGLNDSIMISVGIVKIILALLLLVGALKFPALIKPSAAVMSLFMIGAVYFHISISDGILPTLPAASMLLCCLLIVFSPKFLGEKRS
jgi:glucan phosphoethanolaminetransferase (alkaline phosphatase superfamily)